MQKIIIILSSLLLSQLAVADWIGDQVESASQVRYSSLNANEKEQVKKHVELTARIYQNALHSSLAELSQMIGASLDLNKPLYEMNETSYDVFKKHAPSEFNYPCYKSTCNDVEFSRARGYSTPAEIYGSIYAFSEHIHAANYKYETYVNSFFDKSLYRLL